MDLELILEEIRANNELKIDNDRKLIKQCPKGHLYADVNKNKTYYRQVYTENGKRFRIGISSKPEIINGLLKKRLLSAELEALISDNEIITEALNHIERFSMPEEALKLSKEFSDLPKSTIFNLLNSTSDPWEQEEYEQSTYKIEQKTQMTSFGLQVRSKSELLIAEKLREFKVPFRYEQVLHIGNTQVIPDFTIRRSDGKIFLWEHEGLTSIKSYVEWQSTKTKLYASIDIVPWDNLIVTYDNEFGQIDLRIVESEIKNKLIL